MAGAIPEQLLVADVLGACSSLNGRFLHWQPGGGDQDSGYACARPEVPPQQRALLLRQAEAGWLLRRVEGLIARLGGLQSVVHEALVAAARREVSNYYRRVAILEAQAGGGAAGRGGGEAGALTLRRLQVWLSEPLGRLRVLAGCLEAAAAARGGQVITALHALSKHGDPAVRRVVQPALEEVCVPYFKQIAAWVLGGALGADAEAREFLVAREALPPPHCDDPAAQWRGGYRLHPAMKPSFISDALAADILTAGKTIAFLREWCGDTRWAAAIRATADELAAAGGTYQQLRCARGGRLLLLASGLLHLHDTALQAAVLPLLAGQRAALALRKAPVPARLPHLQAPPLLHPYAPPPRPPRSWLESAVGEVKRSVSAHLLDIIMAQQGLPRHLAAIKRFLLLVRPLCARAAHASATGGSPVWCCRLAADCDKQPCSRFSAASPLLEPALLPAPAPVHRARATLCGCCWTRRSQSWTSRPGRSASTRCRCGAAGGGGSLGAACWAWCAGPGQEGGHQGMPWQAEGRAGLAGAVSFPCCRPNYCRSTEASYHPPTLGAGPPGCSAALLQCGRGGPRAAAPRGRAAAARHARPTCFARLATRAAPLAWLRLRAAAPAAQPLLWRILCSTALALLPSLPLCRQAAGGRPRLGRVLAAVRCGWAAGRGAVP